jgi:hypothetical protein
MQVIPTDVGLAVGSGRDGDHAGAVRGAQGRQQALGELEVAEVVGGELLFVAACVEDPRTGGHDAGVVDQDVQGASRGAVPRCERVDRCRVGKVEVVGLDVVDAGECGGGAVGMAHADEHRGARAGQCAGGFESNAAVSCRDDDVVAGQVDARKHVLGGGRGGESGPDRVLFLGHAVTVPPPCRTMNGCKPEFLAR